MASSLERGSVAPKEVESRPEELEIPRDIEAKTGVQSHPSDFRAQVSDDSGTPLIQTQQNQKITIEIPTDQATLKGWSKGSIASALTWFARFWLRIIKKAIHFGWRIVVGGKTSAS